MNDIKKHIIVGFGIALWCGLPAYLDSGCLFAGLWAAVMSGVIAGGIKEWCDNESECNEWSWKDLGWTCVGSAVAALLIILMHYAKG